MPAGSGGVSPCISCALIQTKFKSGAPFTSTTSVQCRPVPRTVNAVPPSVARVAGVASVRVGASHPPALATVMLKLHWLLFPTKSVAEHDTSVSPIGNTLPDGGSQTVVARWAQSALAVTPKITLAPQVESAGTTMSATQWMSGG